MAFVALKTLKYALKGQNFAPDTLEILNAYAFAVRDGVGIYVTRVKATVARSLKRQKPGMRNLK